MRESEKLNATVTLERKKTTPPKKKPAKLSTHTDGPILFIHTAIDVETS